jgi:hypothetical protein
VEGLLAGSGDQTHPKRDQAAWSAHQPVYTFTLSLCLLKRTGTRRKPLPSRAPGMELPEFNDLQDLHEVHDMLSERIRKWPERWLGEGREEGKLEARREMARNLMANTDMDDKAVAEIADLPVAEVARLRGEY